MTTQSNYGRTRFPNGSNLGLLVIADEASDFILRAEDHRHALMQVGRLDVHDALISAGRNTARLFDDEGHRIGFVQQTQLAAFSWILCALRVQERATAPKNAMHFGHHQCHPAHIEIDAARAGFPRDAFFHVALYRLFPETLIGRIDGKFHRVRRNDHVRMGQHEFADVAIQSEAIHAMTGGDHQHGCWAIQRITGANLRSAGLQKVRCGRIRYAFRCAQNREYRPNGDVHVDVGRTVQRIKYQQIFALRILCRNRIHIIHFFGSHRRQVTTPLGGFDKHLVGDDVQLLLRLTLNVLATRTAQHTDQLAFVDIMCDLLAGYDDVADQASEIAPDTRDRALFFDDELDQTLAHALFPHSVNLYRIEIMRAPLILGSSPENGTQPRSPVM